MHSGEIIREAREALDLTQEQLGELAGVDHSTVSRIENGLIDARPLTIKALTDALGRTKGERRGGAA